LILESFRLLKQTPLQKRLKKSLISSGAFVVFVSEHYPIPLSTPRTVESRPCGPSQTPRRRGARHPRTPRKALAPRASENSAMGGCSPPKTAALRVPRKAISHRSRLVLTVIYYSTRRFPTRHRSRWTLAAWPRLVPSRLASASSPLLSR
jgi:hypothetical protein